MPGVTVGVLPGGARPRADRVFPAVVALETLACLVLGAITIGKRSFWSDETVSALFARHGVDAAVENFLGHDATMMPYNVALALWQELGTSESWLRSLSLLACAATVPFVALVGRRLFEATSGMIAAGILAVSPFVARYAQEVRGYGLVLFLVTLGGYLLLRALDDATTGRWSAYAAVAAMAIYVHVHAALVIAAQLLVVVLMARPTPSRRTVIVSGGVFFVLLLPLGVVTLSHGADQIGWIDRPAVDSVWRVLRAVSGGTDNALLFGVLGAGTLAIGVHAFRRSGGRLAAWPYVFVTAWWLVPIVVTLTVSLVTIPMFISRYLIIVLPGIALAVGACLRRLPLALAFPMLVIIAVASASTMSGLYRSKRPDDWRAVDGYVLARANPGDRVVLCPAFLVTPFAYYAYRDPRSRRIVLADQREWWPDGFTVGRAPASGSAKVPAPAVWVIRQNPDTPSATRCSAPRADDGYTLRATTSFGRFGVERWTLANEPDVGTDQSG